MTFPTAADAALDAYEKYKKAGRTDGRQVAEPLAQLDSGTFYIPFADGGSSQGDVLFRVSQIDNKYAVTSFEFCSGAEPGASFLADENG